MCFYLKTSIQMVYLWSQNIHISMSWPTFASQPCWWFCWHKIEILISVCKGLGFIPASSKRINISWLPSIHSYTGDIWAPADIHPPFFLSYKLGWILQSSETTCRWLLILEASTYIMTIMMYVRKKIPYLSDTMSLGFWWVSEQPQICCAGEEAAARLQVFLWEGMRDWGYGTFGRSLLVLQWVYRLFYHSVSWAGLALEAETFHTGDLFQKTVVVLGLVWSTLWKVKDTFHMAFLQVIDRSFKTTLSVTRPMLPSDSGFCHCSWYYVQILYLPLHLFSLQEGTVWNKWSFHLLANLDVPAGPWNPFC